MTATRVGLCLLLLFATPVVADEFGISGANVAGSATVLHDGRVLVGFRVFDGDTQPRWTLEGRIVRRTATALTMSYERQVTAARGVVDVLAGAPTARRVTFTVTLTATEAGYAGAIEGIPQTWVRQEELRGATVLIVPGLACGAELIETGYLSENRLTLASRGLATLTVSAAELVATVRARGDVYLFAHGSGATAAIAALSDPANRDLLPKVRGLMALQPSYAGSAAADLTQSDDAGRGLAARFFDRQELQVTDLLTASRAALLRRHPYPIATVPTVVVRTSFAGRPLARPRGATRRSLYLLQKVLARAGAASDGVTSLEAQRIPGAPAELTLEDMDHMETCVRGESRYTPCQVTNRVLDAMLATRAQRAQ
jgi:hypothetical protein